MATITQIKNYDKLSNEEIENEILANELPDGWMAFDANSISDENGNEYSLKLVKKLDNDGIEFEFEPC